MECIISTDDESYTYNKRINRLAAIQEHRMIRRAIERGAPEEKIAEALGLEVASIHRRSRMLNGICREAIEILNFSSYNYLGYSTHPQVIDAAKAALDRYGLGAASSPVQAGTSELHARLEATLLELLGLPGRGVSLFSSGLEIWYSLSSQWK